MPQEKNPVVEIEIFKGNLLLLISPLTACSTWTPLFNSFLLDSLQYFLFQLLSQLCSISLSLIAVCQSSCSLLLPPHTFPSLSQLVPCTPVLQFRLQHVRVLGLEAQLLLLLSLPGLGSVPVSSDRLVVPDYWCFCVTDVARVSGVMGGIHQERLGRKCAQVPALKVAHVLWSDEWDEWRRD